MHLKSQHIIVIIQDLSNSTKAVSYAFQLAKIFKAKVAFINLHKDSPQLSNDFIADFNPEKIPYKYHYLGNMEKEPNNSIEQLDGLFMLTQFSTQKFNHFFKNISVFKLLSDARIPTLLLSENTIAKCDFKDVYIPVNHKKESKDMMIWASYFGRFNKAKVHLVTPKTKAKLKLSKIKAILIFTKRMYEQFNFDYYIIRTKVKSSAIQRKTLFLSEKKDSSLSLLLFKFNKKLLKSLKTLLLVNTLKKHKNPILLINPLKEYYFPCD